MRSSCPEVASRARCSEWKPSWRLSTDSRVFIICLLWFLKDRDICSRNLLA